MFFSSFVTFIFLLYHRYEIHYYQNRIKNKMSFHFFNMSPHTKKLSWLIICFSALVISFYKTFHACVFFFFFFSYFPTYLLLSLLYFNLLLPYFPPLPSLTLSLSPSLPCLNFTLLPFFSWSLYHHDSSFPSLFLLFHFTFPSVLLSYS